MTDQDIAEEAELLARRTDEILEELDRDRANAFALMRRVITPDMAARFASWSKWLDHHDMKIVYGLLSSDPRHPRAAHDYLAGLGGVASRVAERIRGGTWCRVDTDPAPTNQQLREAAVAMLDRCDHQDGWPLFFSKFSMLAGAIGRRPDVSRLLPNVLSLMPSIEYLIDLEKTGSYDDIVDRARRISNEVLRVVPAASS